MAINIHECASKRVIYDSYHLASSRNCSSLPLFALHDSSDGMPDNNASPLDFPLRKTAGHTHLQSRLWSPFFQEVFGSGADRERHGFETGDEDTIC